MRKRQAAVRQSTSIRKNDEVRVIAGRDKGKSGRVLSVDLAKRRVTVEHAGMIKRHTRPNPGKNVKGGILEREGGNVGQSSLLLERLRHAGEPERDEAAVGGMCQHRLSFPQW